MPMPTEWSHLLARRALLVTGKGGVGKTTVVATLARVAAATGKRVLCAEVAAGAVTSSPLAHALGAAGSSAEEPLPVADGISVIRLTPTAGHRQFLRDTLRVQFVADAAMRSTAMRGFLLAAPTFAEMGILYRFLDLLRRRRPDGSPAHELVIVDLPATGHALAFAQFPATLLKMIPGGPVGKAVREGLALVTDPERTAALVVALPESLPISEAIELTRGLCASQIPVAGIVLNRVLHDPFDDAERAAVDQLVAQHWPVMGARSLRRIDGTRRAIRRLGQELTLPLLVVEESMAAGAEVPIALAVGLLGQREESTAGPAAAPPPGPPTMVVSETRRRARPTPPSSTPWSARSG
jgi:anion-transporting  ArsA/GET3 family ATPase